MERDKKKTASKGRPKKKRCEEFLLLTGIGIPQTIQGGACFSE
jgi:hypothetical protein